MERRDEVWDCVEQTFFNGQVAEPDRKRVGRVVKLLKQHGATAVQIREAVGRYMRAWPNIECSPESIVKHWSRFAIAPATAKPLNAFRIALEG